MGAKYYEDNRNLLLTMQENNGVAYWQKSDIYKSKKAMDDAAELRAYERRKFLQQGRFPQRPIY